VGAGLGARRRTRYKKPGRPPKSQGAGRPPLTNEPLCSELPTQQPTRLAAPANRRCYDGRGGDETLALLKNGRSSQRFPVRALLLVPVCAAGGGEGRERERVRPPSPRLPRFFSGRYLPGVRPALLAAPAARSGLVELVDSSREQRERGVGRSFHGRPVSWSLWCFLLPFSPAFLFSSVQGLPPSRGSAGMTSGC